jgi:hypothetical protein
MYPFYNIFVEMNLKFETWKHFIASDALGIVTW